MRWNRWGRGLERCSNRTFMELKSRKETSDVYPSAGSNRTFMELKLTTKLEAGRRAKGSNRTFMELKYLSLLCINADILPF